MKPSTVLKAIVSLRALSVRSAWRISMAVVLGAASLGSDSHRADATPVFADWIFVNGAVYTMNEKLSWVSAMAIRGGRFIYVGSDAGARALAGPNTVITDLAKKMAMPGLVDSHLHPLTGGNGDLYSCKLSPDDTIDAIKTKVTNCVQRMNSAGTLKGIGWSLSLLADRSFDFRPILDAAAPNNPIILTDLSGHNVLLNSKALARFDPKDPGIVRTADGRPTGLVLQFTGLDASDLLKYTPEQEDAALASSVKKLNRYGVLAFTDAAMSIGDMPVYLRAQKAQNLTARVRTCIRWDVAPVTQETQERDTMLNRGRFTAWNLNPDCAKIFLDGVIPARTAAMIDPYPDGVEGKDWRGKIIVDTGELASDVAWLNAHGLTVKMHAAGDRAMEVGLDAVAVARKANGPDGPMDEIAHSKFGTSVDFARYKSLRVVADASPAIWYASPIIPAMVQAIGEDRGTKIYPFKSWLAASVTVQYGSDWPSGVGEPNPWYAIAAMVTRANPQGNYPGQLWPSEVIPLADALKIVVTNGALAGGFEKESGSIETGKSADLIILDHNIFSGPPAEIAKTHVEAAMLRGKLLFSDRPL